MADNTKTMAGIPAEELAALRADNERMRDLLDRRPALNAGLVAKYHGWTQLVYMSDAAFAVSHIPPAPGTPRH